MEIAAIKDQPIEKLFLSSNSFNLFLERSSMQKKKKKFDKFNSYKF